MKAILLLGLVAACHGAALPASSSDLDSLMDLVHQVIAEPEMFASALGMQRVKRSTSGSYDKEFSLPIGLSAGIKYKDPANPIKGAEGYVHMADLQKYVKKAHSKSVDVDFKFDGGASEHDGLFLFNVKYALEHKDGDGVEKGDLTFERKKVGNKWSSTLKTTAEPFSGTTIMPPMISNLELFAESDRNTMLNAHYVNPNKNRNLHLHVKRDPGKKIEVEAINGPHTSNVVLDVVSKEFSNFEVKLSGNIRGEAVEGFIKRDPAKGNINVLVSKGGKNLLALKVLAKTDIAQKKFNFQISYALMGKSIQGKLKVKYDNNQIKFLLSPSGGDNYGLDMKLDIGTSIKIVATKNKVEMWNYETLRTTTNDAAKFEMEATSVFTLNPESMLHAFLEKNYPFGAFQKRTNNIKIFVDKVNKNVFFNKFMFEFDVIKDGAEVLCIKGDTRKPTYNFEFKAPNLFEKLGRPTAPRTLTITHVRGKSLDLDAHVGVGNPPHMAHLQLQGKRAANAKGGHTVDVKAFKDSKKMWTAHMDYELENDADHFHFKMNDNIDIDADSFFYKNVFSKYKYLTPFTKREGEFEFRVNKKEKNVLLPQFLVRHKVTKDAAVVMDMILTTAEKPYRFHISSPNLLPKISPSGVSEFTATADHVLGDHLIVHTTSPLFSGFKVEKTGNGDERRIEWNGKEVAKGDFSKGVKQFKAKTTLPSGKWLEATVSWKRDFETSCHDNGITVVVTGSERNSNLAVDWKFTHFDWDLSTPESGTFKVVSSGQGPNWGDYSIKRDGSFDMSNKVATLTIAGEATFTKGPFAPLSPAITNVDLKFDLNKKDLSGKFAKLFKGKEYSITFPKGVGFKAMPMIKFGA